MYVCTTHILDTTYMTCTVVCVRTTVHVVHVLHVYTVCAVRTVHLLIHRNICILQRSRPLRG